MWREVLWRYRPGLGFWSSLWLYKGLACLILFCRSVWVYISFCSFSPQINGLQTIIQIDGTLLAPPKIGSWPKSSLYQWINFKWIQNFTIQGEGTADGQGSNWWSSSLPNQVNAALNNFILLNHWKYKNVMIFSSSWVYLQKKKAKKVPNIKPTVRYIVLKFKCTSLVTWSKKLGLMVLDHSKTGLEILRRLQYRGSWY